jgi:hypothetical protein
MSTHRGAAFVRSVAVSSTLGLRSGLVVVGHQRGTGQFLGRIVLGIRRATEVVGRIRGRQVVVLRIFQICTSHVVCKLPLIKVGRGPLYVYYLSTDEGNHGVTLVSLAGLRRGGGYPRRLRGLLGRDPGGLGLVSVDHSVVHRRRVVELESADLEGLVHRIVVLRMLLLVLGHGVLGFELGLVELGVGPLVLQPNEIRDQPQEIRGDGLAEHGLLLGCCRLGVG